ncbi:MAG: ABC-type transport system, permease component [Alphaproteobacteria bacterium]|jgi:putative ABC transport system permease protein|nr:ABC-type transport system, permease component [Alphaproteobacteria bacterium]MDF3034436.1 ABC-type transport system, permease component [Alphaproteobacteria bacterium]
MSAPLNWIQLTGAVELGFIYSLVVIGVYLSFRTLQFPDLTVDGSFPLGAAVAATFIALGINPYAATFAAVLAGACAGMITAWLSTHLRMLNLLAGILTMMALYSVNLRIMGRPNVSLLGEKTLLSGWLGYLPTGLSLGMITIIVALGMYWFLSTRLGLAIRATGSNAKMGRAQGINDRSMIIAGLSASNALVALGGALYAQVHGFADVTMGFGTIIYGLAAVIIGEALFPTRTVFQAIGACILGGIIYFILRAMALNVGFLQASDLNLVTAVMVATAMLLPNLTRKVRKG